MKLSEIIAILEVKILSESEIDQDMKIHRINSLKDGKKGELSLFESEKYKTDLLNSNISVILVREKHLELVPTNIIKLISKNPYVDMAKLSKFFAINDQIKTDSENYIKAKIGENVEIAETVYIGSEVVIGDNSKIRAGTYIGDNSVIGNDSLILPNVTIYHSTIIGNHVIIHSGAVIGSDGFGFATNEFGEHFKIYHNGNVIIGNNVEIGANTTIDRAVFGNTYIRNGVKIDNLVQVGHNCDIGENSLLVAQSGIAGSTRLGRNVVMGGQSGSVGHIEIAPFTIISGKGGVTKSIKTSGKIWSGYPLFQHNDWLKLQAIISRLLDKS